MVLLAQCAACAEPVPKVDVKRLASDAQITIAGQQLILPLVALPEGTSISVSFSLDRRSSREAAIQHADQFSERVRDARTSHMDRIEVATFMYGSLGELLASRAICPRLQRKWAQAMCDDAHDPLITAMPRNRVWLVDLRKIDLFDNHVTVGRERMGDQLRSMKISETVNIACDRRLTEQGTRFCVAAVRIKDDLGAVWDVWEGPGEPEPARTMAVRESEAVKAFVTYGVGAVENYDRLRTVACKTQRPDRYQSPGTDRCTAHGKLVGEKLRARQGLRSQ